MSILDRIDTIKGRVKAIYDEALKEKWIDENTYRDMLKSIEKDKITIGVVGQMKYGKSTMINALIFGKNILPTASTPMTASLSYITYGQENIEVEFFSREEWEDIKKHSQEKEDSDVVRSAKEIVERAEIIKGELNSLLGKKRNIKFNEISEYVGEGGKYVPITKALTISYPSERLKGVDIVDTPGFNDPVVSREIRAKEFLTKADVIIVLLYAQRPFDKSDKDIIFNKIRTAGTGKIVVIVNKFDQVLDEAGSEDKVIKYIEERFDSEMSNIDDEIIRDVFRDVRPIPFSSLMALLGRMDDSIIKKDSNLSWYYDDFKRKFPVLRKKDDFIKYSRLTDLESAIDEIIRKDKLRILVNKPITFILGKIGEQISDIENKISELESEEKALRRTKREIEDEINGLKKLSESVKKKIINITDEITEKIKKERNNIETEIKNHREDLIRKFDLRDKYMSELASTYINYCKKEIEDRLIEFKKFLDNKAKEFKNLVYDKLKELIREIDEDIELNSSKYLTFSSEDVHKVKERFFDMLDTKLESELDYDINIDLGTTFLWWGADRSKAIMAAREQMREKLNDNIITSPIVQIYQNAEGNCISFAKEQLDAKLIKPILESLQNADRNFKEKEERQNEIKKEKQKYGEMKEKLSRKADEINNELSDLLKG